MNDSSVLLLLPDTLDTRYVYKIKSIAENYKLLVLSDPLYFYLRYTSNISNVDMAYIRDDRIFDSLGIEYNLLLTVLDENFLCDILHGLENCTPNLLDKLELF